MLYSLDLLKILTYNVYVSRESDPFFFLEGTL